MTSLAPDPSFLADDGAETQDVGNRVKSVSFFLPHFGDGGVERTTLILAREFADYGASVELLTLRPWGPFLGQLPDGVKLTDLGTRRAITCLPRLARHLRKRGPDLLISAQSYANVVAIWAHALAGRPGRLIVTERLAMSAATSYASSIREQLMPMLMRRFYPRADAIIANSEAGAHDLADLLRLPRHGVGFIHNPTLHDDIFLRAKEPLDDPWFQSGEPPVILGVGRLTHQKDFHTLIEAFAIVRRQRECRLVILGEGNDRDSLKSLAEELGVGADVGLAGFADNPYKYMAHSDVFVLSSRYEGLPNVLIEAMGLGTPVISTDCPGGAREILLDGELGPLVPVGDSQALAREITEILAEPESARRRVGRGQAYLDRFRPQTCLARYLELAEGGR